MYLSSDEVFVLLQGTWDDSHHDYGIVDNFVVGVFTDVNELLKAVDKKAKELNKEKTDGVLHYRICEKEKLDGVLSWDWVFIPVHAHPAFLSAGGGPVPKRNFWGKNLLKEQWYTLDDEDFCWWEKE